MNYLRLLQKDNAGDERLDIMNNAIESCRRYDGCCLFSLIHSLIYYAKNFAELNIIKEKMDNLEVSQEDTKGYKELMIYWEIKYEEYRKLHQVKTLKEICIEYVREHRMDTSVLPYDLQLEFS